LLAKREAQPIKNASAYRAFMVPVHHTGMTRTRHHTAPLPALSKALLTAWLSAAACWPIVGLCASAATDTPPTAVRSIGLPDLGDGTEISPAAERRLGDSIVRSLYRDPDYIDDAILSDYVQSLWQPLLRAARARGDLRPDLDETFAWQILLSRERAINAFALPGGYFGLYLGMVGIVQTRDELASVLGHEMSHVTQRHFARKTDKDVARTPWMIGGMILGLIAASKSQSSCNALNQCTKRGIDHILEEDVGRVLGVDDARLEHGKPALHEEDEVGCQRRGQAAGIVRPGQRRHKACSALRPVRQARGDSLQRMIHAVSRARASFATASLSASKSAVDTQSSPAMPSEPRLRPQEAQPGFERGGRS
jgi:hypothetical protein